MAITMALAPFDPAIWITSFFILLLLVFSGFFSGSETALTTASRGKLHTMSDKGSKGAKKALELRDDSERLIGGILLGNNLVNILATSLATTLFVRILGDSAVVYATLVMTVLVLVFAEVLPKTYAILNSEKAAAHVSRPIAAIVSVLGPIVAAVNWFVAAVLKSLGVKTDEDEEDSAQQEIAGAISLGHVEGAVEKEQRDRLLGALDLKDRVVDEIMLHRSDIEMIDATLPPAEIINRCLNSRYTRLPIFSDNPENIIGVIHAKDLLRAVDARLQKGERVSDITNEEILGVMKEPYFIPETTSLDDQMRQFLRRRSHFALVVDEYGGLQGLITLEDILEEIVGEITDEYDEEDSQPIKTDNDGNYLIDGSATLRDLNRAYDWSLPDDEANTIAGLVIHEAQMIPYVGQVFHFHRFRIEIAEKELNRITKLKMRPLR
ncbi:MAG: HlyC/CorC family transporter [Pseudomonadota bacterium]